MLHDAGHVRIVADSTEYKCRKLVELTSTSLAFSGLVDRYRLAPDCERYFVLCPPRLLYALCRVEMKNWLEPLGKRWSPDEQEDKDEQEGPGQGQGAGKAADDAAPAGAAASAAVNDGVDG